LCQMKLTSFSITTFFQKQEIGYQEAGCYDMASCFLSEERF
ncbi:formate dehydrogenase, partial [Escherichia coli]|nr:formate dehydrogenase [Escherichia coli]